jgi:hypothetical protein
MYWAEEFIIIVIQDANVKVSLPLHYTSDDYYYKDTELLVAVALTISFIFVELITFGTGLTMFSHLAGAYCKLKYLIVNILLMYFFFSDNGTRFWSFVTCILHFGHLGLFPLLVDIRFDGLLPIVR